MAQLLTHRARRANLCLGTFWGILVLALPACTVGPWEKEFWSPPAATGAAPIEGQAYPIRRASGEGGQWPNLGDVPARQPAPLSTADEARELQAMMADRASGQALAATVPAPAALRGDTSGEIAVPAQPPSIPPEIGE